LLYARVLIINVAAGGEIISRTAVGQYFQFLRPSFRVIAVCTSHWINGLYYGVSPWAGRVSRGPAAARAVGTMLTS
jgi:hypothetical protein